jgi:hypothetical protein
MLLSPSVEASSSLNASVLQLQYPPPPRLRLQAVLTFTVCPLSPHGRASSVVPTFSPSPGKHPGALLQTPATRIHLHSGRPVRSTWAPLLLLQTDASHVSSHARKRLRHLYSLRR